MLMALLSRSFLTSIIGGVAVVAIGGTALTAANTVPGSVAGSGTSTISGYTVTDVAYTVNASNPQNLDAVVITYDDAPGDPALARVSVDNGATWHNCNAGIDGGANTVTCDSGSTPTFVGTSIATASNLIIVLTD